MSTSMEMKDLMKFVMDLMETMYPNGGLVIPHRTLHVEQQLGLHTMEVLITDIPYPPPILHLLRCHTRTDCSSVTVHSVVSHGNDSTPVRNGYT
jgi:hypothetical protein